MEVQKTYTYDLTLNIPVSKSIKSRISATMKHYLDAEYEFYFAFIDTLPVLSCEDKLSYYDDILKDANATIIKVFQSCPPDLRSAQILSDIVESFTVEYLSIRLDRLPSLLQTIRRNIIDQSTLDMLDRAMKAANDYEDSLELLLFKGSDSDRIEKFMSQFYRTMVERMKDKLQEANPLIPALKPEVNIQDTKTNTTTGRTFNYKGLAVNGKELALIFAYMRSGRMSLEESREEAFKYGMVTGRRLYNLVKHYEYEGNRMCLEGSKTMIKNQINRLNHIAPVIATEAARLKLNTDLQHLEKNI